MSEAFQGNDEYVPLTPLATPPKRQPWWGVKRPARWIRALAAGALLWGLAVGVLLATGDIYVGAAVVLGTFVVPVSLYLRFVDGESLAGVTSRLTMRLFACGGLVGFLAAALAERPFSSQPALSFDGWVGIVEESVKLMILAIMTRSLAEKTPRSGFVLGAMVGLGFSAFESAGYALAAMVGPGASIYSVVTTVLTKAAITPFSHLIWTGIAGAALFASSRNGRFRLTPLAIAALFGVAALHASWDMVPQLATNLRIWLAGAAGSHVAPVGSVTFDLLDDAGLAMVSLPSLYVAYRLRRRKPASTDKAPQPASLRATDRSAA